MNPCTSSTKYSGVGGEIDVCVHVCGGGLVCKWGGVGVGEHEFPVTTEKVRESQIRMRTTTTSTRQHCLSQTARGHKTERGTGGGEGGRVNRNTLCCTNVIHFNA